MAPTGLGPDRPGAMLPAAAVYRSVICPSLTSALSSRAWTLACRACSFACRVRMPEYQSPTTATTAVTTTVPNSIRRAQSKPPGPSPEPRTVSAGRSPEARTASPDRSSETGTVSPGPAELTPGPAEIRAERRVVRRNRGRRAGIGDDIPPFDPQPTPHRSDFALPTTHPQAGRANLPTTTISSSRPTTTPDRPSPTTQPPNQGKTAPACVILARCVAPRLGRSLRSRSVRRRGCVLRAHGAVAAACRRCSSRTRSRLQWGAMGMRARDGITSMAGLNSVHSDLRSSRLFHRIY